VEWARRRREQKYVEDLPGEARYSIRERESCVLEWIVTSFRHVDFDVRLHTRWSKKGVG
jgi:hypothetical protein